MKRLMYCIISTFCLICCFNLKSCTVEADMSGYASVSYKFNKDSYLKNAKTFAVMPLNENCGKYAIIASNLNEVQFKAKEADLFQHVLQTTQNNPNNDSVLIPSSKDYKIYIFKPKSLGMYETCSKIPISHYCLYSYSNGIPYDSVKDIDDTIAETNTATKIDTVVKYIVRHDNNYKNNNLF